jgi:hypothetical protein
MHGACWRPEHRGEWPAAHSLGFQVEADQSQSRPTISLVFHTGGTHELINEDRTDEAESAFIHLLASEI